MKKATAITIDPDEYFKHWYYQPTPELYPALSINLRQIIDPDKTRELRNIKCFGKFNGIKNIDKLSKADRQALTKYKVMKAAWRKPAIINYDFHTGDVFRKDETIYIQIAHVDELLEVHSNQSGLIKPYKVTDQELAEWLRTGLIPEQSEILGNQCRREADRLYFINHSQFE